MSEADPMIEGFSAKEGVLEHYEDLRGPALRALKASIRDYLRAYPFHGMVVGGIVCEVIEELAPPAPSKAAPLWPGDRRPKETPAEYLLRHYGTGKGRQRRVLHTMTQLRKRDPKACKAYDTWRERHPGEDPLRLVAETDLTRDALRLLPPDLLRRMYNLHATRNRR